MILYVVSLQKKNGPAEFIDYFKNEYAAAICSANYNDDFIKNKYTKYIKNKYTKYSVVSSRKELNDMYVDKVNSTIIEPRHTLYADILYDYSNDILLIDRGIRYVSNAPYKSKLIKKKNIIRCYIPYEDNMEDKLLDITRKIYGCTKNKDKTDKKTKRNGLLHKISRRHRIFI
jgi:hypothetical protein